MFYHLFFFVFSRSLDSIPESLLGLFRDAAENLIEERDAVDVVAAALAHMSGAKEITSRSLLSSHQVRRCPLTPPFPHT